VEKKRFLTAAFLSVLLLSVMLRTGFVNFGKAALWGPPIYKGEISPEELGAEPPVITILSPQNNSATNRDDITLSLNASVGSSSTHTVRWLSTIRYTADWLPEDDYVYIRGYVELPPALNLTGINGTRIPEGKHNVTAYALEEGKYISDTVIVGGLKREVLYTFSIEASSIVFFTVDRTSPVVSVLSMENKTFGTSDVPLNFQVNESVSRVKYSLDCLNNVTVAGNTTLTGLPDGSHNVTVYATDEAGNTGASETIFFKVETFPTTVVIASVMTVAVISAGLLVYFKKRKR
jgi:hypothetical protein